MVLNECEYAVSFTFCVPLPKILASCPGKRPKPFLFGNQYDMQ